MLDLLDKFTYYLKCFLQYGVPIAYVITNIVLYKMNSPYSMAFLVFTPFLYVPFVVIMNSISFESDTNIGFSLGFISLVVCAFLGQIDLGGILLAVFMLLGFTKFYSFINRLTW